MVFYANGQKAPFAFSVGLGFHARAESSQFFFEANFAALARRQGEKSNAAENKFFG